MTSSNQIRYLVEEFTLLRLESAIREKIVTTDDFPEILIHAIFTKRLDVVNVLIDGGFVGINTRNRTGLTPLEIAIETLDERVVSHILDKGADVNACGGSGLTPLHLAIDIEVENALREVDATGQKVDPVATISTLLLERGADKMARCINGESPAEFARKRGHLNAVVMLQ